MIAAQRETAPTPVAREPGPLDFLAAPSRSADLAGCWTLSDDERLLADAVRDFMDREVLPRTPALESGDLDVFTFELVEDARVALELAWESIDDLDAVLYVHGEDEDQLGFDSPQAVDTSMATLSRPENADLQLVGGVRYTLMVANWLGDPIAPWELTFNVYPSSFPE